jgi:hypothetical protein
VNSITLADVELAIKTELGPPALNENNQALFLYIMEPRRYTIKNEMP